MPFDDRITQDILGIHNYLLHVLVFWAHLT
jgi:hypothetical protein